MMFRPSSLPALVACSHWEKDDTSTTDATASGTTQHELLSSFVRGGDTAIDADSHEYASAFRAYNKVVQLVAKYAPNAEILSEVKIEYDGIKGTADIVAYDNETNALVVIDYKSAETTKDYTPQLLWYASSYAYSTGKAKKVDKIVLAVVYGDTGNVFVQESALPFVDYDLGVAVSKATDELRPCSPSPWCSFCAHRGQCKASVNEIVEAKEVFSAVETIPHEVIPSMLLVATELEKRIKELRDHARKLLKSGEELVDSSNTFGYKLKEVQMSSVDFVKAYGLVSEASDPTLVVKFLNKASISKTDLEEILKELSPDRKERNAALKSCLISKGSSQRLTHFTKKETESND